MYLRAFQISFSFQEYQNTQHPDNSAYDIVPVHIADAASTECKFLFSYHTAVLTLTNKLFLCQKKIVSKVATEVNFPKKEPSHQMWPPSRFLLQTTGWTDLCQFPGSAEVSAYSASSRHSEKFKDSKYLICCKRICCDFCHQAPFRSVKRGASRNTTPAVIDSSLNSPGKSFRRCKAEDKQTSKNQQASRTIYKQTGKADSLLFTTVERQDVYCTTKTFGHHDHSQEDCLKFSLQDHPPCEWSLI